MAMITYVQHDGTKRTIEVATGETIMGAAKFHDIAGIEANCGGGCACATCHAYIDSAYFDKIPAPDDMESEMLEFALDVDPARSRLTCQIKVTEELHGMTVHVPARQA